MNTRLKNRFTKMSGLSNEKSRVMLIRNRNFKLKPLPNKLRYPDYSRKYVHGRKKAER